MVRNQTKICPGKNFVTNEYPGIYVYTVDIYYIHNTGPHTDMYIYIYIHICIYIYVYTYMYIYICIYMSPVPGPPTPPPPQWYPPPTPNPPPTPQNLVFACYLHIYIHIYTYILPFPPLQPRISTLFAALESHDLVNGPCLYISIITFFSNRL